MRTGLERLLDEGPRVAGLGRGARVGLLAHAASVDASLRHALECLGEATGLRVVKLFAPEHGLRGAAQDMEAVTDTEDPETGLPVVSLYGTNPHSLRPAPEALADLDAVLCDLQDVGARYYTFAATITLVMETAAQVGVPVVVLDRPNPLDGRTLEGPVLDPACASFVGRFPLPIRHGLTIGELAHLAHGLFGVGEKVRVVAMEGWRRPMRYEHTGLPWVAPSPNMPTLDTARVYPGGCLLEGTNLSEGRGTTKPFELAGAPWLRAGELARTLRELGLPGASFRAAWFRPAFHKHAGRTCAGVQVHLSDPQRFRAVRTYLELIAAARRQAPDRFDWRREPYEFEHGRLAIDLLLGDPTLRPALESGVPVEELEAAWQPELERFARSRRPFLLYPEG